MCKACEGDFYTTYDESICSYHEIWFVTICNICGRPCISFVRGTCPNCLMKMPKYAKGMGFGKDRRAPLRKYGLE